MNVRQSKIEGLFFIELDIHDDSRGSFHEAWQAEKMEAQGLPHFVPVQSNVSESRRGTLRGIHAEPWEKYIHIPYGSVFGAWVDLREDSPTFGVVEQLQLDRTNAVYLPKGMGNSFQVTSDFALYSYLVTAHWQAGTVYPAVAFDDPDLAIAWPIAGDEQVVSEKDRSNPIMRQKYPHKYNQSL
ncbi:MAG: dTDP-4-dehydrorhamnose 3,5-epimerase family protein [bacterium]